LYQENYPFVIGAAMIKQTCYNTQQSYGCLTKMLHWGMAFLIIGMLAMGLFLDDIPKDSKPFIMMLHKSFGVMILFLAVFRLIWRAQNIQPPLPDTISSLQKALSKGTHHLLYLLMIAMPLSGWLMSSGFGKSISFFGLFDLPLLIIPNRELGVFFKESHELIAWVLIGLIALHGGAALFHHFILKDGILKRMLRSSC
jgi:cytochrome b561